MRQDIMSSHKWMLTHAVAIDTSTPSIAYARQNNSIVTDVFLMILCKAFLNPNEQYEPSE